MRITAHAAFALLGSILCVTACSAQPDAAAGRDGSHVWQMHKYTFVDSTASQPNLVAGSLLAPADWTVRAAGNYIMDCVFSPPRLVLSAGRADGAVGMNIYPGMVSAWSDNPRIAQMYRDSYPEFAKTKKCEVKAPRPIDAVLREGLGMLGFQPVGDTQPVPRLDEELRSNLKRANESLAQQPGAGGISAAAGRLRFSGTRNGKPLEGWLIVVMSTRSVPAPNGQGIVQLIDLPLICELYAAPGQLDANENMLNAVLGTIQMNPEWLQYAQADSQQVQQIMQQAYQKVANIHNQMMQDNLQTQRKIAAIRSDTARYASNTYARVAADRSAALHHSAQQFSLYMGDQAIYKNPSTGERVQMSSSYGHAWASSTGNSNDYVLTDSAAYNPNGNLGSGSWTELQQEK